MNLKLTIHLLIKLFGNDFFYEYSVGLEIDEPEINKLSIDKAIARLALLGIGTEMCMKLTCVPIV